MGPRRWFEGKFTGKPHALHGKIDGFGLFFFPKTNPLNHFSSLLINMKITIHQHENHYYRVPLPSRAPSFIPLTMIISSGAARRSRAVLEGKQCSVWKVICGGIEKPDFLVILWS
jgi:hypothetical protein